MVPLIVPVATTTPDDDSWMLQVPVTELPDCVNTNVSGRVNGGMLGRVKVIVPLYVPETVPVPVAVKVRGLPLARAAAVRVFGPGVVPRTHAACGQPLSRSEFTVTELRPPTVPPPVMTVKVTDSFPSGLETP
jgi:hypothetical protein